MRTLLLAAALSLSIGCSKSADKAEPAATKADEFPTMKVDDVDRAIVADQATAVDCNGDKTRKKYGVVPGAVLTSQEDYLQSELPADKARKLIFYCTDPG